MQDFFKNLVISLADSTDKSMESGKNNLTTGFRQMFGVKERTKFTSTTDVLNYMLLQVTKGCCEHDKLTPLDDYSTILKWVKMHLKGDRFYMIKGQFNDGTSAICVFFADDKHVYAEVDDPKICYICSVIPRDINDLFKDKQIYVQQFNK